MEDGEVFLPPDEFSVFGSHGGHHVIEIHNYVNGAVEECEERRVTARRESNPEPDAHRHDTVMNDVKQRDLVELLTHHEEEL